MSRNSGGNTGESGNLFTFKISGGNLELTDYGDDKQGKRCYFGGGDAGSLFVMVAISMGAV